MFRDLEPALGLNVTQLLLVNRSLLVSRLLLVSCVFGSVIICHPVVTHVSVATRQVGLGSWSGLTVRETQ